MINRHIRIAFLGTLVSLCIFSFACSQSAEDAASELLRTPLPTETAALPTVILSTEIAPTSTPLIPTEPPLPTPLETTQSSLSLTSIPLDGILLRRPSNASDGIDSPYTIVEDGSQIEMGWIEFEQRLNGSAMLSENDRFYKIEDRVLLEIDHNGGMREIDVGHPVQTFFGVVDDQLLFSPDLTDDEVWFFPKNLSKISRDGTGLETIVVGAAHQRPIVSPNQFPIIYNDDGIVYGINEGWEVEPLPFEPFQTGAISPDGRYVAMNNSIGGYKMNIYSLENNELIATQPFVAVSRGGIDTPIWDESSQHILFDFSSHSSGGVLGIRVMGIDGSITDIEDALHGRFSPDGDWIVANIDGTSKPVQVINWKTGKRTEVEYIGYPTGWVTP